MTNHRRTLAAVAATGCLLLAAGCSSDSDDSAKGDDSSTTTAAAESTTTTAADSTATTAASGGASGPSIPAVPDATKQSTDSIGEGGTHEYWTSSEGPSAIVSSYSSTLSSAGWTVERSGGGGSSEGGDAGLSATEGDSYLVLEAGGPSGETFIDVCVWPSKPSDDSCGDDSDADDS